MAVTAVNEYIQETLRPQLVKLGADKGFADHCCEQVELRMVSLLRHWNDETFRSAVLLTGEDEAAFYEPQTAKKEVREFVAVTVRNSPFCVMHDEEHCAQAGLEQPISSKQVQEVTAKAIRAFNRQRLPLLAEEAEQSELADYYAELAKKFPMAWNALCRLGSVRKAGETFEPEYPLGPFFIPTPQNGKGQGGFSPYLTEAQKNSLAASYRVRYLYKMDTFNAFSRNLEAVLTAIEYLFTRGGRFVTTNYYLANGCVQRRIPLREPAHTPEQAEKNLKSTRGLTDIHAQALLTQYEG